MVCFSCLPVDGSFCCLLGVWGISWRDISMLAFLFVFFFYYYLKNTCQCFLQSSFSLVFVDWYVSKFLIFSGKISSKIWDIFFWYLRVIHTPLSHFMKRDTSYERHFFVSLCAIYFVGFLFYKIPSFITEGLDPLSFFFIVSTVKIIPVANRG